MRNYSTANSFYKKQSDYALEAFKKNNLMPRRYALILTNLCNLRCTFCFQERKKRDDRMYTKDWLKVINEIPKNSRITLSGGEPLVYQGFDIIFSKANEFSETNIVTNGLLLSNQKIEKILKEKNFKVLGVSIDTIGNVNRDFKKDQWQTLVEQLNKFVNMRNNIGNNAALDIKTVILDENIDDLFKIHKMVMETLKADTHSLQLLKGAEIQHSDLMFDFNKIDSNYEAYQYQKFDSFINQLNLIKEYDYKNNFRTYLHPNLVDFSDSNKIKKEDLLHLNDKKYSPKKFSSCYAPWSSVHINVDGNLFPCMAVSMGNVKKEKLPEIIFSDKFNKFKSVLRQRGTINGCNRCGYLKPLNNLK
jgi:MoaA/NifB/PqqE/SkfB family radical SAM enzyme